MKYIRDRINYFRQDENRIENSKEFRAAVKEQNNREPISTSEVSKSKLYFFSALVLIIIIGLVIVGVNLFKSMDNPDDIFENLTALYSIFGIFVAIGLYFVGVPICGAIILKAKCKQESQAICIGYEDKIVTNKHGSYMFSCPVYSFNEGGVEYTVYDQAYIRKTAELPEVGSVVPILFDSNDPNRCIINNKVNWRIDSIAIGVFFLVLMFVFYFGVLADL